MDQTFTYASFLKRFGAYFIDALVINTLITILISLGLLSLIGVDFDVTKLQDPSYSLRSNTPFMVVTLLIGNLYYAILHSSKWQATVGKKLVGIKVTNLEGERIHFLRAAVRHLVMLFLSSIFLIGYVMYFFTKKKQTLHDMIAKTVVVQAK